MAVMRGVALIWNRIKININIHRGRLHRGSEINATRDRVARGVTSRPVRGPTPRDTRSSPRCMASRLSTGPIDGHRVDEPDATEPVATAVMPNKVRRD
jgi:hypothetical protein